MEERRNQKIYKFEGKVGWKWEERQRDWKGGRAREEVGEGWGGVAGGGGGGGVEEDEMRPNFLWQSPCSCCRCWGHFTKAGPDANVISS